MCTGSETNLPEGIENWNQIKKNSIKISSNLNIKLFSTETTAK